MRRISSRDELQKTVWVHVEWMRGMDHLDMSGLELGALYATRRFFDRCTFAGSDLSHATLDESAFRLCDFRGSNLTSASLRGANFSGCDLREADLRFADLRRADLGPQGVGQGVQRNDFRGALLEGIRLEGAVQVSEALWDVDMA